MSISQKSRYIEHPEAKAWLRNLRTGYKLSDDTKAKIRQARLANIVLFPTAIQNTGTMNRGRSLPEWQRERVRQAHLGRPLTDSQKQAQRISMLRYVSAHRKDPRFTKKGSLLNCLSCGKFFYRSPDQNKKFCSLECYSKSPEKTFNSQIARAARKFETPSKIQVRLFDALAKYGAVLEYPVRNSIWTHIDIAFPRQKLAVYVDGVYWHSLPGCVERDERQTKMLRQMGWSVLRFSDRDIQTQFGQVLSLIISAGALAPIEEVRMPQ